MKLSDLSIADLTALIEHFDKEIAIVDSQYNGRLRLELENKRSIVMKEFTNRIDLIDDLLK